MILLFLWFKIALFSWHGYSRVHSETLSSTQMPVSGELMNWFANYRAGWKGYS